MRNLPTSPPAAAAVVLKAHEGTPRYGDYGHPGSGGEPAAASPLPEDEMFQLPPDPSPQRGHAEQNQNPAAVRAAHNGTEAAMRASYALDDPRYAGGDPYDLAHEQTTL